MNEKFTFEEPPKRISEHNAEFLADGGFHYKEEEERKEKEMRLRRLREEQEELLKILEGGDHSVTERLRAIEEEIERLEQD